MGKCAFRQAVLADDRLCVCKWWQSFFSQGCLIGSVLPKEWAGSDLWTDWKCKGWSVSLLAANYKTDSLIIQFIDRCYRERTADIFSTAVMWYGLKMLGILYLTHIKSIKHIFFHFVHFTTSKTPQETVDQLLLLSSVIDIWLVPVFMLHSTLMLANNISFVCIIFSKTLDSWDEQHKIFVG